MIDRVFHRVRYAAKLIRKLNRPLKCTIHNEYPICSVAVQMLHCKLTRLPSANNHNRFFSKAFKNTLTQLNSCIANRYRGLANCRFSMGPLTKRNRLFK